MLKRHAREMRCSPTDVERIFLGKIRKRQFHGYKFRHQEVFGSYIVNFVCIDLRLIVELDGGQHAEQKEYDEKRAAYLNGLGYRVVRYWNSVVLEDIDSVLQHLSQFVI